MNQKTSKLRYDCACVFQSYVLACQCQSRFETLFAPQTRLFGSLPEVPDNIVCRWDVCHPIANFRSPKLSKNLAVKLGTRLKKRFGIFKLYSFDQLRRVVQAADIPKCRFIGTVLNRVGDFR